MGILCKILCWGGGENERKKNEDAVEKMKKGEEKRRKLH